MKIKICGLFREADIDYVNEAMPDFAGFVFAPSKRQISPSLAASLRQKLSQGIVSVGVFVNSPIEDIVSLYRDGVIGIAQLHGTEDEQYIARLKEAIPTITVIKSLFPNNDTQKISHEPHKHYEPVPSHFPIVRECSCCSWQKFLINADYYLVDSGAGSGKTFDWNLLDSLRPDKPWFLAGGINAKNIKAAMAHNPFAIDVSSGVETDGIKDREKILQLVTTVREGSIV